MAYTKEQKKEYFKNLRARWQACKIASEQDENAKAKWQAVHEQAGGKISYTSFYFTLLDMKRAGFEGLPYIDTKTFNGWKQAGFIVKKGETAKIEGVAWLEVGASKDDKGEENDDGFLMPKAYKLFHRSQVEAIQ
jgi:hypothetical protein